MGYIDWVQELSRASTGYQDHRMFGGNGALENTSTLGIPFKPDLETGMSKRNGFLATTLGDCEEVGLNA